MEDCPQPWPPMRYAFLDFSWAGPCLFDLVTIVLVYNPKPPGLGMLVLSADCSWAKAGWGVHLAVFICVVLGG